MKKIIKNQNGHGPIISFKDILLLILMLLTFPVSIPALYFKKMLDDKKEASKWVNRRF